MPRFEEQISQRLQAFVSEITELARMQAMEIFSASFATSRVGGRGRAGRPGNGAGPARAATRAARADSGNRRSPEEIDRASQALLSEIQANPGLRVEQLGQTLGASTKDLTLPLKKLLAQKLVRSEGQRRATRYFPSAKRGRGRPRGASSAASDSE